MPGGLCLRLGLAGGVTRVALQRQVVVHAAAAALGGPAPLPAAANRPPAAAPRPPQRRSWHNYSKRLAKAAVGMDKWVARLRQYAVQPPGGMVDNARRSLEVRGRGGRQKRGGRVLGGGCAWG